MVKAGTSTTHKRIYEENIGAQVRTLVTISRNGTVQETGWLALPEGGEEKVMRG